MDSDEHVIFQFGLSFTIYFRTLQKHRSELVLYKTEGSLHENKPYWVSVGTPKRYMYWDKTHKTWYISERLGKSSGY
jgi:hypothetical protein